MKRPDQITVRSCTLEEIERSPTLADLLSAYGKESALSELGKSSPCMDTYRQMAASGVLHAIGAFAPELIGLATVLVFGLPHYGGKKIASMESIFVLPEFRRGGTGLKLLRAAEDCAKGNGAAALMVSAPIGSRLEKVMSHSNYRATNCVFTKRLA